MPENKIDEDAPIPYVLTEHPGRSAFARGVMFGAVLNLAAAALLALPFVLVFVVATNR